MAIDLDGDGIETVGIGSTPVLFDHNADGIRTGTGWLRGDDAWLVLDRNGNGVVDSGRELFGVDTQITAADGSATTAADGFAALRMLDADADGVFDASDAAFSQVRLWQDLNQDGVSQAGELRSLAQAGIAGIGLTPSGRTTNLGNGNTLTGSASVTRSNGSTTAVGSVAVTAPGAEGASNLELASNPFYREFTDSVAWTEAARALPEMGGSGWVRDLREAMSLEGAAADRLEASVGAFAAGSTRDAQRAQIDVLLADWASSSGRLTAAAQVGDFGWQRELVQTVVMSSETAGIATYRIRDTTMGPPANPASDRVTVVQFSLTNRYYQNGPVQNGHTTRVLNAEGAEVLRRLAVLEVFNAQRFFELVMPISREATGSGSGGGAGGAVSNGYQTVGMVTLADIQVDFVNQAYDALRESAYGALVGQTRLRPYLDSIELVIDEQGIRFDTAALGTMLESLRTTDARSALTDLVDLQRYAGETLHAVSFDGVARLRGWIEAIPTGDPLRQELVALDVLTGNPSRGSERSDIFLGDASSNYFSGDAGSDVLDGGAGSDHLNGGNGADVLRGGADNDYLYGDEGDDVYAGGAGSDGMYDWSATSSDVYRFARGDGQDRLMDYGGTDRVELTGLNFADVVSVRNNGGSIVLDFGSGDALALSNSVDWLGNLNTSYLVESVRFADGTSWDVARLQTESLRGTAGADRMTGFATNDTIDGGAGNDQINGLVGNDSLLGGAGDDYLSGDAGADVLDGGEGNDYLNGGDGADDLRGGSETDYLYGDEGDDVYTGGAGYDGLYDWSSQSSDAYRFGRGDGQDTVMDYGGAADRIELRDLNAADVVSVRNDGSALVLNFGGGDTLRLSNAVDWQGNLNASYLIESARFADGTNWDVARLQAEALRGTAEADRMNGFATNDTIDGGEGNDQISGMAGDDSVIGGAGDDYLSGDAGADVLDGGTGNDNLNAGAGNDDLRGGAGADYLYGDEGNDVYVGGTGDDGLYDWSASSNDVYRFGRGDGQDRLMDYGGTDRADLLGLNAADVTSVRNNGSALVLSFGGGDTLALSNAVDWQGNLNTSYLIESVRFTDGTSWDLARLQVEALRGTGGTDTINGFSGADIIDAGDGNDAIQGMDGADVLDGASGDDQLYGGSGNDVLRGGTESDYLYGEEGDDVYAGGTGSDGLYDWSATSNDIYRFARGDGQDRVVDCGGADRVELVDLSTADVASVRNNGSSLVLNFGGGDVLTLSNAVDWQGYLNTAYLIEGISFADGTNWDMSRLQVEALRGTAVADTISGFAGADVMDAGDGNDHVQGLNGSDVIDGGGGDDYLYGGAGNDTVRGGVGSDYLYGDEGDDVYAGGAGIDGLYDWSASSNDVYRFGRGDGQDRLMDYGGSDRLDLVADVAEDQIWFRQVGADLEVSIVGTDDRMTVSNWYSGTSYRLDQIVTADGRRLLDSQVQSLVDAMSSFAPPSSGQTTLPPDYRNALGATITASWQPTP